MLKKGRGSKITAVFLCVFLIASCFNGCKKEEESKNQGSQTVMGRYLEEETAIPEGYTDFVTMAVQEDGSLLACFSDSSYQMSLFRSADGGESWEKEEELSDAFSLTENMTVSMLKISSRGEFYAQVMDYSKVDAQGNGEVLMKNYYKDPGGNIREIDLSKMGIAEDTQGQLTGAQFADEGKIILSDIESLYLWDLQKEEVLQTFESLKAVTFAVAGRTLMITTAEDVLFYNWETGKPETSDETLKNKIREKESNYQMTSFTGKPTLMLPGEQEEEIFYLDDGGIYYHSMGGNMMEQIVDGKLNSISSPSVTFLCMDRTPDGEFYLGVGDESSGTDKLLKYVWSEDTPSVPETQLKAYALYENPEIQQVIALFQKAHPDIYVELEVGIEENSSVTVTDALKNLNTEIMAEKGPDILFMDGISSESYISKGMLEDLGDILKEVDESEGLLPNIKDAYTREDGSIYTMPARFGIPLVQGAEEDVKAAADLKSLADLLEKLKSESPGQKVIGYLPMETLVDKMADVCEPAWRKEDGTVKEEAITEFLTQVTRIYQVMEEEEQEVSGFGGSMDRYLMGIGGDILLVYGGETLFNMGTLYSADVFRELVSAIDQKEGQAYGQWKGQTQDSFVPCMLTAVNSKSKEKDACVSFVKYLFSDEAQRISQGGGLPVNREVYEDIAYWQPEGEEGLTIGTSSSDGSMNIYLDVNNLSQDDIRKIQELGESLKQPSELDPVITEAVLDEAQKCAEGKQTPEEGAKAVLQKVNLYLAE